MSYIEGFVTPVPSANKEAYRKHAESATAMFKDLGATRLYEGWGDDVPDGKQTDFKRAVQAKADETVLFSFIEYPSKEVRGAANKRMMDDPRMEDMAKDMPFDGMRMIWSGFSPILDKGEAGKGRYLDGFVAPIPAGNEQAYRDLAEVGAQVFTEYGATRVVETFGDDVMDGKVTDYKKAIEARDGETIAYSWIEWPDKDTRDAGWKKVMEDPRMQPGDKPMPFDGKRMIYGGFATLVDSLGGMA
ncbi:DUF1428 domain-containing protein [Allosphingosinicella flava]|uniref:DUF1428 domain-containing protein n=2 Tax=Allosphingosinicella flava TaxID=2771430 RepID=A0A7T2GIQ2_9SPHN|nr:DUF1428 domain-containing protein [Sphingosinicella flava]